MFLSNYVFVVVKSWDLEVKNKKNCNISIYVNLCKFVSQEQEAGGLLTSLLGNKSTYDRIHLLDSIV